MVEGTIRVFLGEMLLLPTGLLTAAYLTRKLAPEGYGLFTVSAMMVAWIEWSIAAIFAGAALKLIGEAVDWRPIGAAVARLHFVLGGATALALWLCASPIAVVLKAPELAGYLRLFAKHWRVVNRVGVLPLLRATATSWPNQFSDPSALGLCRPTVALRR